MKDCIRECFEKFGGVDSIIKGNVYIKINGTGPVLAAITNPEVIIATVELIKEQSSNLGKFFVFENSAVTQFTRLVFKLENLAKRIKDAGGKPLYLDEEKSV